MTTPLQYIKAADQKRQADLKALHELIKKHAPKQKPSMLQSGGSEFIAYGKFPYKTKSGCSGDWSVLGLSNRKQYLALYCCCVTDGKYLVEQYAKKFPKANCGKGCIRFKKLEDLDKKTLVEFIKKAAKLGPPDWESVC